MTLKNILVSTLLISLIAFSVTLQPISSSPEVYGPRTDNLLVHIYSCPDAESYALELGEIDINDWPLSKEWIDSWTDNENIQMRGYAGLDMFIFALNNQRWPTGVTLPRQYDPCSGTYKHYFDTSEWDGTAWAFRYALNRLTDRDRYISEILKGYGWSLNSTVPWPGGKALVPPGQPMWYWGYDPCNASWMLNIGGFVQGTTPNPYYDPIVYPCSAQYMRIDPRTGTDLDPLVMYIRIDIPEERAAGELLRDELRAAGIPVEAHITERTVCYQKVMVEYDYHIYTGDYVVGPYIDYLKGLFHSCMYYGGSETSYYDGIGGSPNYIGFCNSLYDYWAERLDTSDIQHAGSLAQYLQALFGIFVGSIPVWSRAAVHAYKTVWGGVVLEEGYGIDNYWTFLNMYNPADDTIDWGFKSNLDGPNVITADQPWDRKLLSLIYDSLIGVNPYNFAEDIGLLAESWETGEWVLGKMYAMFTLREGITWHDGTPVTAEDVKFSMRFTRDCGPSVAWNYFSAMHIVDVDTAEDDWSLGPRDVKVYFDCSSYLMLHWAGGLPIINADLWLAADDTYGWGYKWPYGETYLTEAANASDTMLYVKSTSDIEVGDMIHTIFCHELLVVDVIPLESVVVIEMPLEEDLPRYTLIREDFEWDSMKVRDYQPWNDDVNDNGITDLCEDGAGAWNYMATEKPEAISASTWVLLTANRDYYLTQTYVSDYLEMAFHAIGDINFDGKIDILDLSMIARALGTDDEYPWGTDWDEYNPDTDIYTCISWPNWIIGDGKVDINDQTTAARNYGRISG